MHKNFKYLSFIALPLLTIIVWLIWKFMIPAMKQDFLDQVGQRVEKLLYPDKKRRSKGLRNYASRKSGRK